MNEVFYVQMVGTNIGKCEWFERKYYYGWNQDGGIQDGRIQDGPHHQVKWGWMSLSQIELDWVRALCKMAEFKMVAII